MVCSFLCGPSQSELILQALCEKLDQVQYVFPGVDYSVIVKYDTNTPEAGRVVVESRGLKEVSGDRQLLETVVTLQKSIKNFARTVSV